MIGLFLLTIHKQFTHKCFVYIHIPNIEKICNIPSTMIDNFSIYIFFLYIDLSHALFIFVNSYLIIREAGWKVNKIYRLYEEIVKNMMKYSIFFQNAWALQKNTKNE